MIATLWSQGQVVAEDLAFAGSDWLDVGNSRSLDFVPPSARRRTELRSG
jgi:hypothetical protein